MKPTKGAFVMEATAKRTQKRKRSDSGRSVEKDADADLIFNNFEFSADAAKRRKVHTGKLSAETMLSRVKQVKERLSEMRGTEEGQQFGNQVVWRAALDRAAGLKVHDDPEKLKKSIKRAKKQKEKSHEKWEKFKEAVEKAKQEGTPIPTRLSKPKNLKTKTKTKKPRPSGKGGKGDDNDDEGKGSKKGGGKGKSKGGGKGGKDGEKGDKGGKGGKGSKGAGKKEDEGNSRKVLKGNRVGKLDRRITQLKDIHKKVKDANKRKKKKNDA